MIEADGEAGFYLMVTSVCPVGSVVGCHSAVLFLVKGNITKMIMTRSTSHLSFSIFTFISLMISFLEETVKFVFFFFLQSMKLSSGKEYLPLSSWGRKICIWSWRRI